MFNERSQEKELLDLGPVYYSRDEYLHCHKMLFRVNKLFGFFSGTKKLLKRFSQARSLIDVGCGGGLFLLHLGQHFPEMQLKGIDISSEAIAVAQQELQAWKKLKLVDKVSFNLQALPDSGVADDSVDLVLATLVCHHLSDEDLVGFLQKTLKLARKAVIINDLHRHSLAHSLYKWLSPLLFRNRLITHDGLISIRRGFTRAEWHQYIQEAGILHYQVQWCFPFRWRVILWKK